MHPIQMFAPDRKLLQYGCRRMTDHSLWTALRNGSLQQLDNSWIQCSIGGFGVRAPPEMNQLAGPDQAGQLPRTVTN